MEGLEFCRYDCDVNDPNVKLMLDWAKSNGESGATLLNNSNYNYFNDARTKTLAEGMAWISTDLAFSSTLRLLGYGYKAYRTGT